MSSDCSFQITFDWAPSKPVVVEPSAGQISSDAGLLPFHQFDEQLGLTRQFAEALTDRRHQAYVDHGCPVLVTAAGAIGGLASRGA